MIRSLCALAVVLALAAASPAAAQDGLIDRPAPTGEVLALLPKPVAGEHAVQVNGRALRYKSVAGTLSLLGGNGAITAEIFYTYYAASAVAPAAQGESRPVTFVFNGGPGAASAYLHLGGLGPRMLVTGAKGEFLSPPQRLADNPDTWLAFTDLVFVDPVGTGYSREAPGQKAEDFWNVSRDASTMGAFIRLFLQKTGREGDRLYLAGESYGGFRAALLARVLQEEVGLSPSGVVLISPALELSITRADDLNPLKWALTLPAMAAVKLERDGVEGSALAARLAEVERFALSDYLVALGGGLASSRGVAGRVAAVTGLPADLAERLSGRIPPEIFIKETGRASQQVPSLYDGSLAAPDTALESPWNGGPDAVLDRSVPVMTSAFTAYVRNELNFRTDISYRLLNGEISRQWDYGSRQGYAGALEDLQKARALNPDLRVMTAHGYTDLVTPYFATRYLLNQLPALAGAAPIQEKVYEGGHMMYLRPAARAALRRDVEALVFDGHLSRSHPASQD